MIVADFSRCGGKIRMRIEGHAEHGERGRDIVCAAVSGIAYAVCGYLINFKSDSVMINACERGNIDVECLEDCEEEMKLACLGIYQIAVEYPENLFVRIGAWNWSLVPGDDGQAS